MIRRPPRSTLDRSSAASDVYKRQITPNQLVQSSSENDIKLARLFWAMQRGRVDLVVDLAGGDLAVDLRPGGQAKKNRPGVRGGEVGRSGCYPILAGSLGRCHRFVFFTHSRTPGPVLELL